MSSGKIILLLIALGMICLVLFLGYKWDVYEEKKKRKEKNTKKQNNDDNERFYTEFNPLRVDYKNELNQTSTFASTSLEFKKSASKSNKYTEKFDKTAVIERIDLSKLEVEENVENVEDEVYDDSEDDEESYIYEDYSNSTMVFDTIAVKSDEDDFKSIKSEKSNTADKSTARNKAKNTAKSAKTNTKK